MKRVCVYVDGFNLYHAIKALNDNRLKWLDLTALIKHFLDPKIHELKKIYYFSAYATWKPGAHSRHIEYEKALKASGVETIMWQFKVKDRECRSCGSSWKGHEEKETDVNIALRLLDDAYLDNYDEAIIISQDSDLFPAIKLVKGRFSSKSIRIITPPNMHHSKEMAKVVGDKKLSKIKLVHIQRSLFPDVIKNAAGQTVVEKPIKYKTV